MELNPTKRENVNWVGSMRYRESDVALATTNKYFTRFARWGNAFLVSKYRRMHIKHRHIAGKTARSPSTRDSRDPHCAELFQLLAYRQENRAMFDVA